MSDAKKTLEKVLRDTLSVQKGTEAAVIADAIEALINEKLTVLQQHVGRLETDIMPIRRIGHREG